MLKRGRKEAELSPADESSGDEGLINYFIVKHFIFQSLNQIG